MPELIDRHALKNHLYRAQAEAFKHSAGYVAGAIQSFIDLLDKQPTIEQEVRRGRWAKAGDKQYCTECRAVTKVRNAPFCWHCGAKIDLRTPTEVQLDEADSVMMGGADNG